MENIHEMFCLFFFQCPHVRLQNSKAKVVCLCVCMRRKGCSCAQR